ncbi:putative carbohydrate esterase [Quercus suber]|uniref:Carbohydrate esterase n=1 Tax=Quercus suber TaxID=58331 RepID=A0AAW0JE54_QUESU
MSHEPLHKDIDTRRICGVGLGMPFAHEVLAKDPNFGVIGLVPCAIGGTMITKWADALMARGGPQVVSNYDDTETSIDVPKVFICPIFQVRLLTTFQTNFNMDM